MSHPSGLRPSVQAARQRLAEGREKLRRRHDRGSPGLQVCGALADLLDSVVLDLYEAALADLGQTTKGPPAEIALVPLAGYGRRDVAPYSDVDLMILHTRQAAERVGLLANRLMQDIFDTGLVLGHSVRTPEVACELALTDATICTSLMEARYLAGSLELFSRFAYRFAHQVRRRRSSVVASIDKARREERAQHGDTVCLLEPNVKRSHGGLRDIQLLRWLGFACYGTNDPDSLQLCGAISKEDQQGLRSATNFLLRLRHELHFHAGKLNDVLDRAEQVRIAALLGYQGQGGLLPVEQFMQDYFRSTREVSQIVARMGAAARPDSNWSEWLERCFSHQVERDFRVGPTRIFTTRRGAAKVKQSLHEALRLTDLANLCDKRISREALEAIRQGLPNYQSDVSPEVAARFLSILQQPARLGELLRQLHELGLLEKIIPAFTHARCLLQFNEYHKFTVDEHCLLAVERAAGFHADPGPVGRVYRHIKEKRLLHLALLLHDLGKGFTDDHSDVGLGIAEDVAARLGLSSHEAQTLKFLVHKHLMMSHLAFRRDTSDEQLIVRFAVDVGSPERLEMLFVLTVADLGAVGPGVLNDWKIEVLADLFHRTMEHLAGDVPTRPADARLQKCRQELQKTLSSSTDPETSRWYFDQIQALPAALLRARATEQIAADLRDLRRLKPGEVSARGRYLPETRTAEYTIGTYEDITPGVFHKLTGALSSKGVQILSAEINTLAHGLVFDRFFVADPDYADEPPLSRLKAIEAALMESLKTDDAPSFRRIWRSGKAVAGEALAQLPTVVRIDNNSSDRFTIVDIFTADRMGLLYAISRTLFELGLSVSVAKIVTYLDQVVDVFYVTDSSGRKVQGEAQMQAIHDHLMSVIAATHRPDREGVLTPSLSSLRP